MKKPVVVDLFGSEGVSASGLAEHFEVRSVDNCAKRLERNPYAWFCGDWLEGLSRALALGDVAAVWASPVCEGLTRGNAPRRVDGADPRHPNQIGAVRAVLEATGLPYVIENVEDAARLGWMRADLTLCGSMFDLQTEDVDGFPLRLERHRVFEANVRLRAPRACWHDPNVWAAGVYDGSRRARRRDFAGLTDVQLAPHDRHAARVERRGGYVPRSIDVRRALLGAPEWATPDGLKLCVPPSYGAWVGGFLAAGLVVQADEQLALV